MKKEYQKPLAIIVSVENVTMLAASPALYSRPEETAAAPDEAARGEWGNFCVGEGIDSPHALLIFFNLFLTSATGKSLRFFSLKANKLVSSRAK